ncbi:hypothetical protein BSD967_01270 [Bifidobacterium saguini]|uniref:Uncharacterized protein n=1 Tax=Bifidobacterium saguini TaxID=762210 RepID=A0ABX7SF41_9BIFI|nr:hypothetical protein [Bifidobacterium saguini]QTB91106.1 hypothetical protein BSD967_01270 [Bifidobacterium saguini]
MAPIGVSLSQPLFQTGTVNLVKGGVGGGKTWWTNITFPKPYKMAPMVWTNSTDVALLSEAQDITAIGFRFGVRNVDSNATQKDMFPRWFAYGELV